MRKTIFLLWFIIPVCSFSQKGLPEKILETWDTHCKMNYFLLDSVKTEWLTDTLSSGGRNALQDFVHINETRVMWLQQLTGEKTTDNILRNNQSREAVSNELKKTDKLVKDFIQKNINNNIQSFKGNVVDFMGYLIAHEAHTRGQIILAFKQSGHHLSPKIQYGIWNWD